MLIQAKTFQRIQWRKFYSPQAAGLFVAITGWMSGVVSGLIFSEVRASGIAELMGAFISGLSMVKANNIDPRPETKNA